MAIEAQRPSCPKCGALMRLNISWTGRFNGKSFKDTSSYSCEPCWLAEREEAEKRRPKRIKWVGDGWSPEPDDSDYLEQDPHNPPYFYGGKPECQY